MRKKGDLREERIPAKIQDLALFLSRAIGVHPYRDGFGFNRRRKLVTAVTRMIHRCVSLMDVFGGVPMLEIATVDAFAAVEITAAFHLVLAQRPGIRIRIGLPEGNQEKKGSDEDFSAMKE